ALSRNLVVPVHAEEPGRHAAARRRARCRERERERRDRHASQQSVHRLEHKQDPEGPRWPSLRSVIMRGLLLATLLGAVVLLLVGLVPGSGKRLENASAGWLVAGVALEVIACAGYAWLFHAVFSYGAYRSSPWRSTQIAVG